MAGSRDQLHTCSSSCAGESGRVQYKSQMAQHPGRREWGEKHDDSSLPPGTRKQNHYREGGRREGARDRKDGRVEFSEGPEIRFDDVRNFVWVLAEGHSHVTRVRESCHGLPGTGRMLRRKFFCWGGRHSGYDSCGKIETWHSPERNRWRRSWLEEREGRSWRRIGGSHAGPVSLPHYHSPR